MLRQRGSALDVSPAQHVGTELPTQVYPGVVTRRALRHEYAHNVFVPERLEAMPVPQHLPKTEPELFLFVSSVMLLISPRQV